MKRNWPRILVVAVAVNLPGIQMAHAGIWTNLGRSLGLGWGDGYHARNQPRYSHSGSPCQACGTADTTFAEPSIFSDPAASPETQWGPPLAPRPAAPSAEPTKAKPRTAEPKQAQPEATKKPTPDAHEPMSPSDRATRLWQGKTLKR